MKKISHGTASDTSAYIPEIRNLLNQTLDAYKNQNYDEADAHYTSISR